MKRLFLLIVMIFFFMPLMAQKAKKQIAQAKSPAADSVFLSKLQYRLVGPFRGGRSGAVAGSLKNEQTFYFGATGGGVWKTTDGGSNWANISDKYFGSSIGAVALAPSDESIIYVGEGENTMRGNVSEGLGGMWRSNDGGKTWRNLGLKEGRHIIRILIHPKNPDVVLVAVMGHLFGPNEERGVYKTVDGGKSWKKVLYVNNQTGASDLVMEPGNPDVLYAGTWRVIRTPHSLESGGEGSGLWKSADGGETWKNISAAKGLPKGTWGIVGVAVAPSKTDKLYAIIENANGGLYTSNNAGETWTLTSSDNNIRQRAWYYSKVFVDPGNENLVYCPNVNFMYSRDGGKSFQSYNTPHGDHHDIWIDPANGKRMIVADDGGAQVSFDGGMNWSTYENQPTAQFYRVTTDNAFPYHILGAQQDNSTVRIKAFTYGGEIGRSDWGSTAGFESGHLAADPSNPEVVYGGNYGGYLSRLDHRTGENRNISVWPESPIGAGADVQKFRFQWNFPIFFSPHNPKRLYAAGNALFVTENEGASWEKISPDLTTNDKKKQASSGGPITQDNTSVEYYCTIFAAAESALEKDLLWTGSDDGLVHVSRNGGKDWENVTPKQAPALMMWNSIETDPFKKGAAYIIGTRYKLDDYAPYIYKTEDYGKTWKLITAGIGNMHFTRAMRADKKRPGLLYAGTEYGMYVSYNDGADWKSFQLNLPVVPITDLTIKNNDLIVATQGRAFWVIDDLTIVQQWKQEYLSKPLHVFEVNPSYRLGIYPGSNDSEPVNAGKNPPKGPVVNFYVSSLTDSTAGSVLILDKNKKLIKEYSTASTDYKLELNKGMNQFNWDLKYGNAEKADGMIIWSGVPRPLIAAPGGYYARVKIGTDSSEVPFTVLADPNYKISQQDYEAQFEFLQQVQNKYNEVQVGVKDIRALRGQIIDFTARQKDLPKDVKEKADTIVKQLTTIEEVFHQTKAKSGQDVLNYPIRLNDKLSSLHGAAMSGAMAPSKQVRDVYVELAAKADEGLNSLKRMISTDIQQLNQMIRDKSLPAIGLKK